jgi:Bacteriophage CI repressor helix-turn-helix domain.
MAVEVDDLVEALGCRTDQELAERLGLNRTTIAQWRRRGSVPRSWHFLMFMEEFEAKALAARRRIFGDGDGYYIHMAALAILTASDFDWPELSDAARGAHIQERLLKLSSYIIEVLGDRSLKLFYDYEALVRELGTIEHDERIRQLLQQ